MADRKQVLVAEDSSVIQNLTKKVLQFQNYDIESARDGQQVLDMLKQKNYDIILMDINMPKMNGMECSKQIRNMDDDKKSQVPIIAISGNASNYTEEDFEKAGMDEYIPKPINFDHLVEVVKKHTE
ncbi:MAG: response regulator [Tunicatimonas sp.]|uniref:response regulator n=1 Tax=Tunicatimonas sp. TaxID=1940096 RepID=UPI003C7432E4